MPAARASAPTAILDHLSALADTTRSRILLLVDRHELTVTELCGVMQLPQSTVSRHLKALADTGWIAALAAFAEPDWTVGDLGCGTGQVSAALAPFVGHVVAVDASAAMLQAAKKRLHAFDNVDLRRGELESLPIDDARLDAATMMLVLHHVPEPERALAEVARVLAPGGRLILVDMLPHDRENYRQQMGHVWLGFSEDHIRRLLGESSFGEIRVVPLSPDPRAKGPGLFVATAQKQMQP